MNGIAMGFLIVFIGGWLFAADVIAHRLARSESWGHEHLGPGEAFVGLLLGYAWPLYVVCLGLAWVFRAARVWFCTGGNPMTETFVVSIEVDVEGAEGGWNVQPIFDAAHSVWDSQTHCVRSVTVTRKDAVSVNLPAVLSLGEQPT